MFGLRGEIEHSIAEKQFDTYAEFLQQCYVAENSLKKIWAERERQGRDRRIMVGLSIIWSRMNLRLKESKLRVQD